jgi:hypothetical protein
MGLGWAFQINLVDMWKYTNQNKKVVYAFGTKFGHGLTENSHDLDLGWITTSSLIVYSMTSHIW